MKTHDGNRSKVICKYQCGFSRMSKRAVDVHYENAHGHLKTTFGCHKCDTVFTEGAHVTKHLQKDHGAAKIGSALLNKKAKLKLVNKNDISVVMSTLQA